MASAADVVEDGREADSTTVEMSGGSRELWLLRLPSAVAQAAKFAKPGQEIGRLRVVQPPRRSPGRMKTNAAKADLILDSALLNEYYIARDKALVPSRLDVSMTEASSMAILDEPVPTKEGEPGTARLSGTIMQRMDSKFVPSSERRIWMQLSNARTEAAKRSAVTSSRTAGIAPTANRHIDRAVKERHEHRFMSQDSEVVKDKLMKLFAKHEFYTLDDLSQLTQQPKNHVKDILQTLADYQSAGPDHGRWRLKEEYRYA